MKNIPALVGEAILAVTNNPTVILVLFVIMIFFTGMFLETASQVLIYTPLFLPVLRTLGVDPLVFGLILVVGTAIGQVTPPVVSRCRAGVRRRLSAAGRSRSTRSQASRYMSRRIFARLACRSRSAGSGVSRASSRASFSRW